MQKTANTSANNVALRHWSTIFQSIGREWDDEWAVARAETKGWVKGMARASQEVNHSNAMLRNLFKRLLIKYPLAYSNLCKWHCFGKCNYTSNGNHRFCARATLVWMDDCVHRGHRIFGHLWHSNQFGWSIYFNYNCYYYFAESAHLEMANHNSVHGLAECLTVADSNIFICINGRSHVKWNMKKERKTEWGNKQNENCMCKP